MGGRVGALVAEAASIKMHHGWIVWKVIYVCQLFSYPNLIFMTVKVVQIVLLEVPWGITPMLIDGVEQHG